MSEIIELSEDDKNFLRPYLPPGNTDIKNSIPDGGHSAGSNGSTASRPFVTLTYACSMDSMISLAPGIRTTLSGPETKGMTHYLRLHHDAILVGAGTALADDPSLNCRYPGVTLDSQPRPVVIDPAMRWDVQGSKLGKLAVEKQGKSPWMIHTSSCIPLEANRNCDPEQLFIDDHDLVQTQNTPSDISNVKRKIAWSTIFTVLKQKGADSVMIEGGATVINDLLSHPELIDAVVVTIAPTWLGRGGLAVSPAPHTNGGQRTNAARLEGASWRQFGQDAVLCGRLGG